MSNFSYLYVAPCAPAPEQRAAWQNPVGLRSPKSADTCSLVLQALLVRTKHEKLAAWWWT